MPSWVPRLGHQASAAQLSPASLDNDLAWLLNDVSLLLLCEKKLAPLSFFSLPSAGCIGIGYHMFLLLLLFFFAMIQCSFLVCRCFFYMYVKAMLDAVLAPYPLLCHIKNHGSSFCQRMWTQCCNRQPKARKGLPKN